MRTIRVRAPRYPAGAQWFNTDHALSHEELRGRFQLLDFWTSCCANCLHVVDELRPIEHDYRDILTVVGVHSPKFAHERDPATVAAAIERNDITHPVVNDPDMALWQQYAVKAWPTLVLVDPEGYVVAQAAGEGQASALHATIARLAAEHEARGTLRHGATPYTPPAPPPSTLRFPAKAIVLPAARSGRAVDTLLVADAGHHQVVELDLDGCTELRRFGTTRGEPFAEPNGLALLPPGIADWDVAVADTANHVLRGIRLSDGAITTIVLPAALADARTVTGAVPTVLSPWDVAWWPATQRLVVAAAGVHLLLSVDPATATVEILAGTTVEGLRDGPALDGWLAQPSGLAVDGDQVWFVDAETSALRRLTAGGTLHTAIGEGLFDFGHVDGPAAHARLQHPLGVTLLPDASLAVADTYNGAIRRYDPRTEQVSTLATGLAEPSGALVVDGELVVVESAAHRLVRPVQNSELVAQAPMGTARPATVLAPGRVRLEVIFMPPQGRHLDDSVGPATSLTVAATPPGLLRAGAGGSSELHRVLELADGVDGVLHVSAQAASCDDGGEHPACYLARQDWGVPVHVTTDGTDALQLTLLG